MAHGETSASSPASPTWEEEYPINLVHYPTHAIQDARTKLQAQSGIPAQQRKQQAKNSVVSSRAKNGRAR